MNDCKHLRFTVEPGCRIGKGWCPDCRREVHLAKAFSNLADEMRRYIPTSPTEPAKND
jgi:hypothetical protein